jgi:hypothetical protein
VNRVKQSTRFTVASGGCGSLFGAGLDRPENCITDGRYWQTFFYDKLLPFLRVFLWRAPGEVGKPKAARAVDDLRSLP